MCCCLRWKNINIHVDKVGIQMIFSDNQVRFSIFKSQLFKVQKSFEDIVAKTGFIISKWNRFCKTNHVKNHFFIKQWICPWKTREIKNGGLDVDEFLLDRKKMQWQSLHFRTTSWIWTTTIKDEDCFTTKIQKKKILLSKMNEN